MPLSYMKMIFMPAEAGIHFYIPIFGEFLTL